MRKLRRGDTEALQEAGQILGMADPGCDFFPTPDCLPTGDLGAIRQKWDRALT